MRRSFRRVAILLFFAAVQTAFAGIAYYVTIDTTTIASTSGDLDFQFNPGANSQSAVAKLFGFATDGVLSANPPQISGNVTGLLPALLTFDNGTPYNDYFHDFTYGSFINFTVIFDGPAVIAPDHTSTSGSTFAVALYDNAVHPLLNSGSPNDFLFTGDLDLSGNVAVNSYGTANFNSASDPSVPEPATFVLFASGFCAAIALRRRTAR